MKKIITLALMLTATANIFAQDTLKVANRNFCEGGTITIGTGTRDGHLFESINRKREIHSIYEKISAVERQAASWVNALPAKAKGETIEIIGVNLEAQTIIIKWHHTRYIVQVENALKLKEII